MTTRSGWKRRSVLGVLAVVATLAAAELALRAARPAQRAAATPANAACGACPYLFELDPAHEGIGPQRLRDREVPLERPRGTYRILVLGDSVPYGPRVAAAQTFPKVLETLLDGRFGRVEVVNAGVPGYTPYNERLWWSERGRAFSPDLVLVSLSFPQVVDPLLRWNQPGFLGKSDVVTPPADAIPDPARHEALARAFARRRERGDPLLTRLARRSALVARLVAAAAPRKPDATVAGDDGRRFPSFLAREDDLGLEALTESSSPEWRWLRRELDRAVDGIRGDGARVALVVNPLRYQMAADYPLLPQTLVTRYASERGLACLDLLPPLRSHGGPKLFLGRVSASIDVWHYTAAGHRVVAEAVAAFLESGNLLPPRTAPGQGRSDASPPPAPGSPTPPHG